MPARWYTIEFSPRAARDFKSLGPETQRRFKPRIDALADNPRPHGVEKLHGEEGLFRVRAGDYRIVYSIMDDRLVVLLVKIGHRREVYRGR